VPRPCVELRSDRDLFDELGEHDARSPVLTARQPDLRQSAIDESPQVRQPRSTTALVLPPTPTLPLWRTWKAIATLERPLRSSCARKPRRSTSWSPMFCSRWREYSVTAPAIASSRQRLSVWKSFVSKCFFPCSEASSVTAWQMSP